MKRTHVIIFISSFLLIVLNVNAQWHNIKIETNAELTDIYFLNDTLGYCIGDSSILFISKNSGKSWEQYKLDDKPNRLNEIAFINGIGFIVGTGVIYRSTDKGLSWKNVYFDSEKIFNGLSFNQQNKIWLYAGVNNSDSRGLLYESTDVGLTWNVKLDTKDDPEFKGQRIQAAKIINDSTMLILCSGSIDPMGPTAIYKTTDNGVTWNYYSENINYVWGVSSINPDTLLAWGVGLALTTNAGKIWSYNDFKLIKKDGTFEKLNVEVVLDLNISNNLTFCFLAAKDSLYSIYTNKVNDILSWEKIDIDIPIKTRLTSIFLIDKGNIWCAGISGTIITNSDIFTGINDNSRLITNTEFKLLGNYPNPFNPSTNIVYQVYNPTYLTLTLYDLTGKQIILFKNKFHSNGTYHSIFNFDKLNLSSGVYFYSISDLTNIYFKKFLFIK